MFAILKLSARTYMALDTGNDDAYLGAATYLGLPPDYGIDVAPAAILLHKGAYADCVDALMQRAQATDRVVAYKDSKAAALKETIDAAIARVQPQLRGRK